MGISLPDVYSETLKRKCLALVLGSLAVVTLLILVPGAASPVNSAGTCGSLFGDPTGSQGKSATQELSAFQWLFGAQRLEATCSDIAAARWIYVALASTAALFAGAYLTTRARLLLVVTLALTLLLAVAAVVDGPIAQTAGAAILIAGVLWSTRSQGSQKLGPSDAD